MTIPYAKLGIPANIEKQLSGGAPLKLRLTLAKGLMPLTPEAQLGVLYLLSSDEEREVSSAARQSLSGLPTQQLLTAIGFRTHPKILEFIAQFRTPDAELDQRLGMLRTSNDRTVRLIASRANAALCTQLSQNHERLLVTPDIYIDLYANSNCDDVALQRAEGFLRMQKQLPEVPARRPFEANEDDLDAATEAAEELQSRSGMDMGDMDMGDMDMSVLAEVEAALSGQLSPSLMKAQDAKLEIFDLDAVGGEEDLHGFKFDFADDGDMFSWDLTKDLDDITHEEREEARVSMSKSIQGMSVGQKIKLAYLGNKEVRKLLIRDTNKIVATAVVKSGRLSDQEVATYAGNKNLDNEVLRHIASNPEWTRKYPVKVALVNNPKTPVSTAVTMVSTMQKRDLLTLTRNRNIPSVVSAAALRLYRQKYRK
jgi:hypothetical protein